MEPEYIFRHTAPFKHGLEEADIRRAFETCRYVGQYGGRENVYLLWALTQRQIRLKYCIMKQGKARTVVRA